VAYPHKEGIIVYPERRETIQTSFIEIHSLIKAGSHSSPVLGRIGVAGVHIPTLLAELKQGEIGPVSTGLRELLITCMERTPAIQLSLAPLVSELP
jgi:hypothetical protein